MIGKLPLTKRLLGYRMRQDGAAVVVTFPRWYPQVEIARRAAEIAEDRKLVVTCQGREVRMEDRATDLLRRLGEARARL
jgi:hypothetical protein